MRLHRFYCDRCRSTENLQIWGAVASSLLFIALTGCGNSLADSAKPLVTEIIEEQLGGGAECVAVEVGEEFADNHYRAVATLANGNDLKIVIEDRGNEIRVTIPNQQ